MISPEQLPSQRFEPLRYGVGAWTEHIFFAYDLVAKLRPKVVVELGTDRGESYFAFCQSVKENKTGTRTFAIDHWRGDSHAGSYDSATFEDVAQHQRSHYEAFSTLFRSSFDDALSRFEPESIDLLHIDGHHTEDAVRNDVESWLPKLRPGGILLMHDVAMRGRGFGVWKVWEELVSRGRSFTFSTEPGLGVWEKPPAGKQPELLETLLRHPERSVTESKDSVEQLERSGVRRFSEPRRNPSTALRSARDDRDGLFSYYRQRYQVLQEMMARQWIDGSIRRAPLASETVIQVFWADEAGGFAEEQSVVTRIGHGSWKAVQLALPNDAAASRLRIDFFSALTIVEIAELKVNGAPVELGTLSLGGDCVRLSLEPFRVQITGMDPQLYLQKFEPPRAEVAVRIRLRVL